MQKYDALQCRLSAERKAKYVKLAKANYSDEGTIEFNDFPAVSYVDERGAYVAAWVWVDALDIEAKPMSTAIALHKTTKARVLEGEGVTPILKAALIDKMETLHLIHSGGVWNVSSQITGRSLAGLQTSRAARLYIVYMLEHVGDELRTLPTDAWVANNETCSGVIREAHFKALEQAGE